MTAKDELRVNPLPDKRRKKQEGENKMKESVNYPLRVTHLGVPTLIIEIGGLRIITDPTLDPKGSTYTDTITLTKLSGPAFTDVGKVDMAL